MMKTKYCKVFRILSILFLYLGSTQEYNIKLSEARAKAVRDYLVQMGIEASRIGYKGYGNSRPIADNQTAEGRALNRRIEIEIIKM